MPKHQVTVKQGDTLNSLAQARGFKNFRDAGITSVPSGNFDLIRPGEVISFGNSQPSLTQSTTDVRQQEKRDGASLDDRLSIIDQNNQLQFGTTDPAEIQRIKDAREAAANGQAGGTTTDPNGEINPPTDEEIGIKNANDSAQAEVDSANARFDSMQVLLNTSNKALVDSIRKTYEARIAKMKVSNTALFGAKAQSGFRSGRSKFLQNTQAGILNNEEQEGLFRIGQLEGEMLTLLSQAETARTNGDFKLLNERMSALSTIDQNLQDEVKNLHKAALDQEKEARLRDRLEFDQQKQAFDEGLDRSSGSARAVAEGLATLGTDDEKVEYMDRVAKQLGVDVSILWSDTLDAMDAKEKASINISNIESQIADRQRKTEISAFKADTGRRNSEIAQEKLDAGKGESGRSIETENIMNDVSTLSDVSDAKKEEVKTELTDLGFYGDVPPQWYVSFLQDSASQSLEPRDVTKKWKEYRDKILEDTTL